MSLVQSHFSHTFNTSGMTKWKSALPRYLENAKDLQSTPRLASIITGGIIWSGIYPEKRKDIFFINHEQFGTNYEVSFEPITDKIEPYLP